MFKILIAEDDKGLSNGIALALKAESYLFLQAFDLDEARRLLKEQRIAMVILDLSIPGGNGLDFLREIKERLEIPVILLTARELETDRQNSLKSEADDYITKPFSLMALRARGKAQMRKGHRNLLICALNK